MGELKHLERMAAATDQLVDAAKRLGDHETKMGALVSGLWINNVFYTGIAELDATGRYHRSFHAEYAAITVSDPRNIGPLVVSNGDISAPESGDSPRQGQGMWMVGVGRWMTIPLSGRNFTVFTWSGSGAGGLFNVSVHPLRLAPAGGPA